jgi:hypothetical protein
MKLLFRMSVLLVPSLVFALNTPASAKCNNFYDLCQGVKICTIGKTSGFANVIRDGLARNNGHVVWDGLNQCAGNGVMKGTAIDCWNNCSKGCTDNDYLLTAKTALGGDCNSLPK